ncbi:MAG: uncharacterized membrane protein YbhN (UPF0104 family) [Glaciecola sp.]|jgi:uncharacterized membrane protein YbhN (UPF0104 family)
MSEVLTRNNNKYSSSLQKLIGLIILSICAVYIYKKFSAPENYNELKELFSSWLTDGTGMIYLLLVLAMSFANWLTEAIKWQYLLKAILPIKILRSVSSVLTGLAITIIIPYRMGSFVGRVWHFPKDKRYEGAIASIYGGLAQLFVTVVLGLWALILGHHYLTDLPLNYISIFAGILLLLVSFVYFFPSLFISLLKKKIPIKDLAKAFEILRQYSLKQKLSVVALSVVRYIIFLLQYFLLLKIFNSNLSLVEVFLPIALVFFILSVMPTLLFGIGLRETAALIILGPVISSEASILVSSLILWIVNMILPSIAGAIIFMVNKKSRI